MCMTVNGEIATASPTGYADTGAIQRLILLLKLSTFSILAISFAACLFAGLMLRIVVMSCLASLSLPSCSLAVARRKYAFV